jgi:uncharacterized repeat protein (TIGR01451 family)
LLVIALLLGLLPMAHAQPARAAVDVADFFNSYTPTVPHSPETIFFGLTGPETVAAGESIVYTLSLENTGPETLSGAFVYDPLPVGVEFLEADNDGQLVQDEYGYDYVGWAVPDLFPGDYIEFSFAVQPLDSSGGFILNFSHMLVFSDFSYYISDEFVLTLVGAEEVTPTPTETPSETPTATATPSETPTETPTPEPGGQFEASISLRANPHGFVFENWGGNKYDDSTDFDNATLIRMFGAQNVCHSGSTAQDCVLTAAARQWRDAQLESVRGGHCYGMAVGAQRFFVNADSPANYQAGAANTYALQPDAPVRAHISEMARTQALVPADGSSDQWIYKQGKKPSEILELIRQRFQQNPNDPYVLGFFMAGKGGHAVTPYGIENKGGGIYWLHFYDNNWPDKDRYMIFDTNAETWLYDFAALNPSVPADPWNGNTATDSLALRPTSAHKLSGWACPFCQSRGVTSSALRANTDVTFELLGQGQMLILDQKGRGIGYDFTRNKYINQIAGAEFMEFMGGTGVEYTPIYTVPFDAANNTPYTVILSGDTVTKTVQADLLMSGPGYAVGMSAVNVNPNQNLTVKIRPDGRQITFISTEAGVTSPDIFLALDPDPDGYSYIFGVGGFELPANKRVSVTLDLAAGKLIFEDNDGATDTYDLLVIRISPTGEVDTYENDGVAVSQTSASTGNAEMNFGAWDGAGDMTFTIDGSSQTLGNEHVETPTANNKIFLPQVKR